MTNFRRPRSTCGAPTARGSPAICFGRRLNGQNEGNGVAIRVTGRTSNGVDRESRDRRTSIGGPSNAADERRRRGLRRLLQHDRELDRRRHRPRRNPGRERTGRHARRRRRRRGRGHDDRRATGSASTTRPAAPRAERGRRRSSGTRWRRRSATGSFDRGNVIAGQRQGRRPGHRDDVGRRARRQRLRDQPGRRHLGPQRLLERPAAAGATPSAAAPSSRTAPSGRRRSGSSSTARGRNVIGNLFHAPDPDGRARFTTAAIHLDAGRRQRLHRVERRLAARRLHPLPRLLQHASPHTGDGAPGIWVDGANDARIWRNAIGAELAAPIPGPPIRIGGGAIGADIGDNDDDAEPAQLARAARRPGDRGRRTRTKIVIGDNEGLRDTTSAAPTGALHRPAPRRRPRQQRHRQQRHPGARDHACRASPASAGPASPGRAINVLLQEGPAVSGDPDPIPEGTTYPPSPSVATVGERRHLGHHLPDAAEARAKLVASQTTADGSSEYASPLTASESNPPPLITFQSGPSGVVDVALGDLHVLARTSRGTRLTCSVDGGAFVPCESPVHAERPGHRRPSAPGQGHRPDRQGRAARLAHLDRADPRAGQPGGGAATPTAAAKAVRFSSVVSLPSAKRCISRRTLRLTVRAPKGAKLKSAEVRLGKRKVRTVRKAGKVTGQPQGPAPRGVRRAGQGDADRRPHRHGLADLPHLREEGDEEDQALTQRSATSATRPPVSRTSRSKAIG